MGVNDNHLRFLESLSMDMVLFHPKAFRLKDAEPYYSLLEHSNTHPLFLICFADELVFVASYIQMFGASVIQSPFGLIQRNMSA